MRESAVLPVLIYLQKPNDGSQQDNRRLHEEIPLLLNPRAVEVEHNRVGTLVSIRYIRHKGRIDGIAAVRFAWVIEVNHEELRLYLVSIQMMEQMIVGYLRKVGELIVVDIHGKAFLYLLLDIVVHNGVGLTRTWCTEHHRGTEGIDHVNPTVVPFLLIVEACREIDGVFIFHQARFLHETLVLRIKHIVHQIIFKQTAHPYATHQQTDIANGKRKYIEESCPNLADGQCQQPPIEKEKGEA